MSASAMGNSKPFELLFAYLDNGDPVHGHGIRCSSGQIGGSVASRADANRRQNRSAHLYGYSILAAIAKRLCQQKRPGAETDLRPGVYGHEMPVSATFSAAPQAAG